MIINGVYWGYNPFTNFQRDILVERYNNGSTRYKVDPKSGVRTPMSTVITLVTHASSAIYRGYRYPCHSI